MESSLEEGSTYTPDATSDFMFKDWGPTDKQAYVYMVASRRHESMDDLITDTFLAAKSHAKPRIRYDKDEMIEDSEFLGRRRTHQGDHVGRREVSKRLHVLRRDRRRRRSALLTQTSISKESLRQWREKVQGSKQLLRRFEGSRVQGECGGLLKSTVQEVLCAKGVEVPAARRVHEYPLTLDAEPWSPPEFEEFVFVVKQELSRMNLENVRARMALPPRPCMLGPTPHSACWLPSFWSS